jgi:acyl-CoA dehydrogenase-like protein
MSATVTDLLVETANSVFSHKGEDLWVEVEKAGLLSLPGEVGLAEIAAVVRVSAYHAVEIEFAERVLQEPLRAGGASEGDLWRRGALMRAIQMVGAMERIRDMTVTFASDRRQFGQPLNRFQMIQSQLAELASETALASAALQPAIDDPSATKVGIAKIVGGRAAGTVAAIAHQVHGAIGMTSEHVLHNLTLRLWRWRDEFGTESSWASNVGAWIALQGPEAAWLELTS